jgi:hypothetical protein
MRSFLRTRSVHLLMACGFAALTHATGQGKEFHWLGDVDGGNALNPANWLEQPDPDLGALPSAADQLVLRWGDRPSVPLEFGGTSASFEHALFNHADNGGGSVVNGTGTLTFTRSGGLTNVDAKSIETQGGHRTSTFNVNVEALGLVEARNGHDLVFKQSFKGTTIHAYRDDDAVTTSDVIFDGPVTLTGYNEAKFMTGTGTVTFNNQVLLDHTAGNSGFGIRNGMTAVLGPDFTAMRFNPDGGGGLGLDTVDMYSGSGFRLEGDGRIGYDTDLFSRYGGPGSGHDPNNKLDLNGFSDTVELLGTHPGANFIIDFGAAPGANSLLWHTTHHMPGTYEVVNFEVGVDTLQLGPNGDTWWTPLDMTDSGGGSQDIEVKKSQITINGVPYAPYDPSRTTPYWTLVDPNFSHEVEVFNFVAENPDFDGNDVVDGADFLIWQRFVGTGTLQTQGDANGDGAVNGADLQIWRDAFGQPGVAAAVGAIPEPSALALVGLAVLVIGGRRRERRSRTCR